jgi:hypothetical protein
MKLLSHLNVSNISNIEADSGYIFQKHLLKSLAEDIPELEVYLICPKDVPLICDSIKHITPDFDYSSKYSVRFDFPWSYLMGISDFIKDVDYIIVNQPELTANYKALFEVLGNKSVLMATYFHYIPIKKLPIEGRIHYTNSMDHGNLAKTIFSRQLESLNIADYCVTCSDFGIEFIKENARILDEQYVSLIDERMIKIPPPNSLHEDNRKRSCEQSNVRTLIYNHRLYDHYGTRTIFEWLNELFAQRKDFDILVTDPTGERSIERDKLDISVSHIRKWLCEMPFVRVKHIKNHSDYYRTLSGCYAGFAPLKRSALWRMSAVDIMALGKPLFAPDYACFPEMLNNNEFLIFKSKIDFFEKVNRIFDDEKLYLDNSEYCLDCSKNYETRYTTTKFRAIFKL